MKESSHPLRFILLKLLACVCFLIPPSLPSPYEGPWYDPSAFTECKEYPEPPLYGGGILRDLDQQILANDGDPTVAVYSPAYVLQNLTQNTKYALSCWIKIEGAESALVRARFLTNNSRVECVGSALAKTGCWSFLKGGFAPDSSSATFGVLFFQSSGEKAIKISVTSASLQPFTDQQWRMHQDGNIRRKRKRTVNIHVSDTNGQRQQGATVTVEQIYRDFPFGSAIAKTILGNSPYQNWLVKRFNAAVFENELKWYVTEPEPDKLNYSLADQMLAFAKANRIIVRGHNIFWEDPIYTPPWVRNLTSDHLLAAVKSRIQSLMCKYKEEFIHWDVSNEMLHFNFYEERLGPNASLSFFEAAQSSDPHATLFMNDFNVIETCDDVHSTVDSYVSRLRELKSQGAAILEGIGLEGHFNRPNLPLMRAVLDKLATLDLPIWLTEIDISKTFDHQTQAVYLEEVLREGFSHPSVNGIMLWTALHPNGCYQMCLTDNDLHNLPAGDVVDELLQEWKTPTLVGQTDDQGSYIFDGFLGEYRVSAKYENTSATSTLSLCRGDETKHFNIQL